MVDLAGSHGGVADVLGHPGVGPVRRRYHDGTWSINLDGVPLNLSKNVSDGSYTRLDHVSLNQDDGKTAAINSYIYWGPTFDAKKTTSLATVGASAVRALDLDADKHVDLVFNSYFDGKSYKLNSLVYKGSSGGFNSKPIPLPTQGALRDGHQVGSLHTRQGAHTFTSRVFDTGVPSPTYVIFNWTAALPKGTQLALQLRSASSQQGLASAPWRGPKPGVTHYLLPTDNSYAPKSGSGSDNVNPVHGGDRYIQYRATFEHRFGNTPVLDRVEIHYK